MIEWWLKVEWGARELMGSHWVSSGHDIHQWVEGETDTQDPQHLKILHLYCCVSCPTLQDIALSSTSAVISQTTH